ncbi:MAG: hypothetical protein LEGION0398_MBIBDBAK_00937 [Legionellaceae bacterium]
MKKIKPLYNGTNNTSTPEKSVSLDINSTSEEKTQNMIISPNRDSPKEKKDNLFKRIKNTLDTLDFRIPSPISNVKKESNTNDTTEKFKSPVTSILEKITLNNSFFKLEKKKSILLDEYIKLDLKLIFLIKLKEYLIGYSSNEDIKQKITLIIDKSNFLNQLSNSSFFPKTPLLIDKNEKEDKTIIKIAIYLAAVNLAKEDTQNYASEKKYFTSTEIQSNSANIEYKLETVWNVINIIQDINFVSQNNSYKLDENSEKLFDEKIEKQKREFELEIIKNSTNDVKVNKQAENPAINLTPEVIKCPVSNTALLATSNDKNKNVKKKKKKKRKAISPIETFSTVNSLLQYENLNEQDVVTLKKYFLEEFTNILTSINDYEKSIKDEINNEEFSLQYSFNDKLNDDNQKKILQSAINIAIKETIHYALSNNILHVKDGYFKNNSYSLSDIYASNSEIKKILNVINDFPNLQLDTENNYLLEANSLQQLSNQINSLDNEINKIEPIVNTLSSNELIKTELQFFFIKTIKNGVERYIKNVEKNKENINNVNLPNHNDLLKIESIIESAKKTTLEFALEKNYISKDKINSKEYATLFDENVWCILKMIKLNIDDSINIQLAENLLLELKRFVLILTQKYDKLLNNKNPNNDISFKQLSINIQDSFYKLKNSVKNGKNGLNKLEKEISTEDSISNSSSYENTALSLSEDLKNNSPSSNKEVSITENKESLENLGQTNLTDIEEPIITPRKTKVSKEISISPFTLSKLIKQQSFKQESNNTIILNTQDDELSHYRTHPRSESIRQKSFLNDIDKINTENSNIELNPSEIYEYQSYFLTCYKSIASKISNYQHRIHLKSIPIDFVDNKSYFSENLTTEQKTKLIAIKEVSFESMIRKFKNKKVAINSIENIIDNLFSSFSNFDFKDENNDQLDEKSLKQIENKITEITTKKNNLTLNSTLPIESDNELNTSNVKLNKPFLSNFSKKTNQIREAIINTIGPVGIGISTLLFVSSVFLIGFLQTPLVVLMITASLAAITLSIIVSVNADKWFQKKTFNTESSLNTNELDTNTNPPLLISTNPTTDNSQKPMNTENKAIENVEITQQPSLISSA